MQEVLDDRIPVSRDSAAPRGTHVATFMLLLATVAWGAGFTWAKEAQAVINARVQLPENAAFGPLLLLAVRFFAAAIVLLILVPRARRGWNIRSAQRALMLGAMLGIGMNLQHLGLSRTSEAVTAFLTSLTILFVPMLMTFVWRKPPAPIFWAAVAIATLGVWLMTGATPGGFGIGEIFGVGCAIVFSVYLIVVNDVLPRDEAWRMTAGMFIVAGVVALAPCAFVGPALSDFDLKSIAFDPRVGPNFALLVIFPTLFSYVVMNIFQPRIDPTRAALIYLMEPIFASVYAWLARGATLTSTALVGAALILIANGLVELLFSRREAS